MKKRVVINCQDCIKNIQNPNSGISVDDLDYDVEQLPETFEELKELCREEDISKCDDEIKIKWHNNTSLYFYEKDGEIICKDEDSCIEMIIGYDRTPAQMWEIIKSLTKQEEK